LVFPLVCSGERAVSRSDFVPNLSLARFLLSSFRCPHSRLQEQAYSYDFPTQASHHHFGFSHCDVPPLSKGGHS
jgi:hypothetical protein